jgi:hypothetical protein
MENQIMHTTNLIPEQFSRPKLNWVATLTTLALLAVGHSQLALAQKSEPKNFSSAGEASKALFQAVQNEDEEAVERILGVSKDVTSSSDDIEDKLERNRFSQKYQEMHRLVREPDGSTVLYIGAENWPFPIPLVSKNGAWFFDSDAGSQEILFRTIGENETSAIHVCQALAKAAKAREGSETTTTGNDPVVQYAQTLVAESNTKTDNTAPGDGYQSSPFNGYYFRMVTGDSAAGNKTGNLILVAYPADYRSSGVMTFVVTKNGVLYEKDLGPKTTIIAKNLKSRPDSSWHRTE